MKIIPDYPEPQVVICGDFRDLTIPVAQCIFADPPDNLGKVYDGYKDKLPEHKYHRLLGTIIARMFGSRAVCWLSVFHKHQWAIWRQWGSLPDVRMIPWFYTFGQQGQKDLKSSYRPIFRYRPKGVPIYPDAIRVESARQKGGDKRADPRGCVPGDVWEFSRICGTFNERRKWHPTQHPEALMERIVLLSTQPGEMVVDLFGGTGTTLRVCKRLGRRCVSIDISENYCQKVAEENDVPMVDMR